MSFTNLLAAVNMSVALQHAGVTDTGKLQQAADNLGGASPSEAARVIASEHTLPCNCKRHASVKTVRDEIAELALEVAELELKDAERTKEFELAKKEAQAAAFWDAMGLGKHFVNGHLIHEAAFDVTLIMPRFHTYKRALAFEAIDAAMQKYVSYSVRGVDYVVDNDKYLQLLAEMKGDDARSIEKDPVILFADHGAEGVHTHYLIESAKHLDHTMNKLIESVF